MKVKPGFGFGDTVYSIVVYTIVILALFVTLYPFIYIVVMSVSDLETILTNGVSFFPKTLYFGSYQILFRDSEIWTSYYNTIWYTVTGTVCNVFLTFLMAYVLSRKKYILRKFMTKMFLFTMFFSGGMIPTFLLIFKTELYNTRLAMIVPGLVGVWYLIICKTYIESTIPEELVEAFKLESKNEFMLLGKIIVPLSKPIVATLTLFYAVSHWNRFYEALIYLRDADLMPLQIYLRRILMGAVRSISDSGGFVPTQSDLHRQMLYIQIKYAVIIVAILPILMIYPFIQKYFVKGIMIGSVKG